MHLLAGLIENYKHTWKAAWYFKYLSISKFYQRDRPGTANGIHLDTRHHISHFIPEEIDQIGEELSLKILRTRFFSFHLGVLGMSDSFLKFFGYRKNIIYELKNKNIALMAAIFILLPFAFILESFAAAIGRGGIVRKYLSPNIKIY